MNAAQRNAMQRGAPVANALLKVLDRALASKPKSAEGGDLRDEQASHFFKSTARKSNTNTNRSDTMATTKKQSAKKPAQRKAPKTAKVREQNKCLCGCGGLTFSRFQPGHDARLVGVIKRGEIKRLTPEQAEFAKSHGIKLGETAKEPKAKAKKSAA